MVDIVIEPTFLLVGQARLSLADFLEKAERRLPPPPPRPPPGATPPGLWNSRFDQREVLSFWAEQPDGNLSRAAGDVPSMLAVQLPEHLIPGYRGLNAKPRTLL